MHNRANAGLPRRLLNTREASEYLGISDRTLERWRLAGQNGPPFIKLGHLCRYAVADLDRWVAAGRCTPHGEPRLEVQSIE